MSTTGDSSRASLEKLPQECINHIVNSLATPSENDTCPSRSEALLALSKLGRTNKRFHKLCEPLLYRYPVVTSIKEALQLMVTLDRCPQHKALVRSFGLRISDWSPEVQSFYEPDPSLQEPRLSAPSGCITRPEDGAISTIARLLERIPSHLEQLSITASWFYFANLFQSSHQNERLFHAVGRLCPKQLVVIKPHNKHNENLTSLTLDDSFLPILRIAFNWHHSSPKKLSQLSVRVDRTGPSTLDETCANLSRAFAPETLILTLDVWPQSSICISTIINHFPQVKRLNVIADVRYDFDQSGLFPFEERVVAIQWNPIPTETGTELKHLELAAPCLGNLLDLVKNLPLSVQALTLNCGFDATALIMAGYDLLQDKILSSSNRFLCLDASGCFVGPSGERLLEEFGPLQLDYAHIWQILRPEVLRLGKEQDIRVDTILLADKQSLISGA